MAEWLKVLTSFLGYQIPLGVCMSVVLFMIFVFDRIHKSNITQYEVIFKKSEEIEERYRKQIEHMEKRIEKLQSENQSLESQVKTLKRKVSDCGIQKERR